MAAFLVIMDCTYIPGGQGFTKKNESDTPFSAPGGRSREHRVGLRVWLVKEKKYLNLV